MERYTPVRIQKRAAKLSRELCEACDRILGIKRNSVDAAECQIKVYKNLTR